MASVVCLVIDLMYLMKEMSILPNGEVKSQEGSQEMAVLSLSFRENILQSPGAIIAYLHAHIDVILPKD